MRINIQSKLFISLAGLTIAILGAVLNVITTTLTDKIEQKIIEDFANTQNTFTQQQRLIYDRLVESCYLIGENPAFKANVSLDDPPTVYQSVEEFSLFAKVDLIVVTDSDGKVLARLRDSESFGDDLKTRNSILNAVNGVEPDTAITWPELWGIGGNLFQVVSLPVYARDAIIGTLTLGTRFGDPEARALKGESHIDINIFYQDRLIGSSFKDPATSGLQNFVRSHKTLVDTVMAFEKPSPAFTMDLKGEDYYAFISPLGRGAHAYYVATVPVSIELRILKAIRRNIYISAAIFLVITLIFAFLLGKTFSRPILRLVQGMDKVKAGDLDTQVKPSTKDEIGLLTQSFNDMISGLRERMHLSRYVGSHTLDMVRQSASNDVNLGGSRQELAVLFSDVRGFTAFSENRSPEEVINMLNRYLGFQAEIVDKYQGSVDKFVGDEMFALFFGENCTERAIQCAIDIQQRVKKEHESDPLPINIGIGINYGPVILGNMGARDRMDYTAIGAVVNLGARLCSGAKERQILVPKEVLDNLTIPFKMGNILLMTFKGFSQQLKIAEVLSE